MHGFSLRRSWNDFYGVMHGGRRVAILTPARPATVWPPNPELRWNIILDPAAYPDVPARNLPYPLNNHLMAFDTFQDVLNFLGIAEHEEAA